MNNLNKKRILLGITGGIAAYKSCDLVRRLIDYGADVRVVMTESAKEFVTPLTFQALSGNPVHHSLLDESAEAAMGHIELARWADVVLIAPATANTIAKLSNGVADDLLSTVVLASSVPVLLAPAMNQQMWRAEATQVNLEKVQSLSYQILGPASGSQACGDIGPGRMLEPLELCQAINDLFSTGSLAGKQVLITAGPTREAIDPVRFITNRSSGKMGYAIAEAAIEAGATVTLVSGPTVLAAPEVATLESVESTEDMLNAVMKHIENVDVFISTAAVADYSVNLKSDHKIKKSDQDLTLTLAKTPDILASVAGLQVPIFTVGFAAETEQLEQYAKAKLINKQLDMIAANLVGNGLGFDSDENELQVYWHGGEQLLPRTNKTRLARQLIELIAQKLEQKNSEWPKTESGHQGTNYNKYH